MATDSPSWMLRSHFERPGGGWEETRNIVALDIRFCGGSARGEGTFCLAMRHFSAPSASRQYLP